LLGEDGVRVGFDEADRWLAVERGAVTVVANLADRAQRVPVAAGRPRELLLASAPYIKVGAAGVDLPPESAVILGPA
jgi:hypothetical protein